MCSPFCANLAVWLSSSPYLLCNIHAMQLHFLFKEYTQGRALSLPFASAFRFRCFRFSALLPPGSDATATPLAILCESRIILRLSGKIRLNVLGFCFPSRAHCLKTCFGKLLNTLNGSGEKGNDVVE